MNLNGPLPRTWPRRKFRTGRTETLAPGNAGANSGTDAGDCVSSQTINAASRARTSKKQREVVRIVVVHTDDTAWWHSFFGWADLLASGVLEPIHRGQAVAFRPPAWDERGRPGAIELPADASLVIVEGVGASRREIAHLLDAAVWVQSDLGAIERRNAARVAASETSASVVARWMQEEFAFVAEQRPWERALAVVAGTQELPHDPATEVVLAPSPSRH
jgi:hypothetical protein